MSANTKPESTARFMAKTVICILLVMAAIKFLKIFGKPEKAYTGSLPITQTEDFQFWAIALVVGGLALALVIDTIGFAATMAFAAVSAVIYAWHIGIITF